MQSANFTTAKCILPVRKSSISLIWGNSFHICNFCDYIWALISPYSKFFGLTFKGLTLW